MKYIKLLTLKVTITTVAMEMVAVTSNLSSTKLKESQNVTIKTKIIVNVETLLKDSQRMFSS